MKFLLIPLALVAGSALACPADDSRDALAPAEARPSIAMKAKPTATPPAARVAATAAKPVTKVATKTSAEPVKRASL